MNCSIHENEPIIQISTSNGLRQGSFICIQCSYPYQSILSYIQSSEYNDEMKKVFKVIPPKLVESMINSINESNTPFYKFVAQLKSFKENESYFDSNEIKDLKKRIKENIDKLQSLLKIIETILDEFEKKNNFLQQLLSLVETEFHLNCINKRQRMFLANIIENDVLQQWKEWRESCLKVIQQQKKEMEKVITNLIVESKKCQIELNGPKHLQGAELFGIKYGEYQYIIDGSIQQAGIYQANKKYGMWQEYGKRKFYPDLQEINYQILYEDGYIKYIKDGLILQMIPENQEQMNLYNVEQLENLEWKGLFKKNKQQGLWLAFWRGECLDSGGYYDDLGFKNGVWKELYYNYWDNAQVKFYVNYKQGKKVGRSKIIYEEQIIGGGDYQNGKKNGEWVEINQHFCKNQEITERGQYRNDIKIGKWNIDLGNQEIVGGSYDENGKKNGQWTEIHQNYHKKSPIFYVGNYDNGVRNGEWQIILRSQKIGGGIYVNGMKQGIWKQISENFYKSPEGDANLRSQEVYYVGKYQNNLKIGEWETNIIIKGNILMNKAKFQKISIKGKYIQGLKDGIWIEISNNFNDFQQIILKGEYKHGVKKGLWQIYKDPHIDNCNNIIIKDEQQEFLSQHHQLGGKYDDNGRKINEWIELYDNFNNQPTIIYKGRYNEGLKEGRWNILQNNIVIGGGDYIEGYIKNGDWIEIYDNFNVFDFTYEGNYQDGFRVGQWSIKQKNQNTQSIIGGGEFNILGKKQGPWTELHENYNDDCQIKYRGEYNYGRKYGKWHIKYLEEDGSQFQTIGGGEYDWNGLKQGLWIELYQYFTDEQQITVTGYYNEGRKQGVWKFICKGSEIGSGEYSEEGFKTGIWKDPKDNFSIQYQQGIRKKV